jgi:hypothetical protein
VSHFDDSMLSYLSSNILIHVLAFILKLTKDLQPGKLDNETNSGKSVVNCFPWLAKMV